MQHPQVAAVWPALYAEAHPLLRHTVRTAAGFARSGKLDRLLAMVVSLQPTHSGQAFVRLKVGGWCEQGLGWAALAAAPAAPCTLLLVGPPGSKLCALALPGVRAGPHGRHWRHHHQAGTGGRTRHPARQRAAAR